MRQKLMPGARIVMIVKNSCPIGTDVDSGAYAVQPVANEPPGAKNDAVIIAPAIGSIQNDSAFRRGKAMSGAPIISGRTKFASPAKIGMMNRKIISDAWTLKRPLYVSESTN